METQAEKVPEKVYQIGRAMGIPCEQNDQTGRAVAQGIQDFCSALGVTSFSQYGVREEDLDTIVQYACSDIIMSIAPRRTTPEELKAYLLRRL